MTSGTAKILGLWACVVAALLGGGCDRWESGPKNEVHEANYIEGNNFRLQGQTNRAIQSFERALHVNPQNAQAHMAIGDLYMGTLDYTSASYHYNRCSRLMEERGMRPDPSLPGLIEQCELRLALKYSERLGRQQTDARIDELRQKVAERDDALQRLQAELARLRLTVNPEGQPGPARPAPAAEPEPTPTVSASPPPTPVTTPSAPAKGSSGATPPAPVSAVTPAPTRTSTAATKTPAPRTASPTPSSTATRSRSYTVRAGDTPASIARRAGISTKSFLAANPGLNPRSMKPGQSVNIPNP